MDSLRSEVENAIKLLGIDRSRAHEVSKLDYDSIIRKIENCFVRNEGCLHWSNLGGFSSSLKSRMIDSRGFVRWYYYLAESIPDNPVYVLLEDDYDKFWVYEMHPEEMCRILDECSLCDFYIVSKKYTWLISENHSGAIYFVGDITPPDSMKAAIQEYLSEKQRKY